MMVQILTIDKDDVRQEMNDLRHGWKKYNNYMERQINLILSANYTDVFEKHPFSFGKVDASFIIRKSLGSFAIAV